VPVNANVPVRVLSPGADGSVEQTNAAPAKAAAVNQNASDQSVEQAQGGGGDPQAKAATQSGGGQGPSQDASQSASGAQVVPVAAAPAVSAQAVPVNANVPLRLASPGNGGSVNQTNAAPAKAEAVNANASGQSVEQSAGKAKHPDPYSGGGSGPSQSASQKAEGKQVLPVAAAPAVSAQVVPVNANVPVRLGSPGDEGSVNQTNAAPAKAKAVNANASGQSVEQWAGKGSGADQKARQKAEGKQILPIALAPALAAQLLPINANIPVRLLSPGDGGNVSQSNLAPARAKAINANASGQSVEQWAGKGSGADQSAKQEAKGIQILPIAFAPALSAQVVPVNLNLPISVANGLIPPKDGKGPKGMDDVRPVGGLPLLGALPLDALPLSPVLGTLTGTLGDPVGSVTGLLADPVGGVTGVVGGLPLVGGLVGGLPVGNLLGTATGLLGGLPVGNLLGTATGLLGGLPLPPLGIGV
jgi:hypothetical protein